VNDGSTVRRNVSLHPDTDLLIRQAVAETHIPFSDQVRLLFGTPAAAKDTVETIKRRHQERKEAFRAQLRKHP